MLLRKWEMPLLALLVAALAGTSALANDSGATANGCTYAIVNGNYTYSCQPAAEPAAAPTAAVAPTTAPAVMQISSEPPRNQSQVVRNDAPPPAPSPASTASFTAEKTPFSDSLYLGSNIGSVSVTESKSGSATGLGLSVSQNLDDFVGFELGYSYAKTNLNLGLAQREGQTPRSQNDSSLANHLVSGEVQFHLTDTLKRLRPFAGVGLGWRASSLEEDAYSGYGGSYGHSGGSLSQNGVGLVGSLGAKIRLADRYQLSAGMRYFRPLSTQNATLSTNAASNVYGSTTPAAGTRLSPSDSALTSSSLLQIYGGFHVAL
ncbi:MAG: outer membrane beta-barrel protein [Bdellovibrionales bacterium]|nr:outer membrane beta-barrel protein [Bdellovibrionales bacterium]